ncbi:hypothetical protein [Pyxidicoccus trucidator]|uniref:hypothetical protein n=1 Tax=Pyxidicoccus trucidator TaxID=2709662 RepID=UPI0013DC8E69|nr:hypothetical protein [Pyxidicoccus trucidator]
MADLFGILGQRGARGLVLCMMALLSVACGDDYTCEGREGTVPECPFFAEDGTLTPKQLEFIQRVATPVTVNGGFSEAELVEPREPAVNAAFFSFPVEQGHRYRFACLGRTLESCTVRILNGEGRRVGLPINGATGKELGVAFKVRERGTYYAMVVPLLPQPGARFGTFRYRLQGFGVDEHGDRPEEASGLGPSSEPFSGTLQGPGDHDVFSFSAVEGGIYGFTCEGPGDRLAWRLSTSASTLNNTASPLEGQARLVFKAEATGTRLLSIEYAHPDFAPPGETPEDLTPGYTCRFEWLGSDDHGDTNARATVLGLPVSSAAGALESPGDSDVFSLTLEAAHYYRVRCVTVGSGSCNVLFLPEAGTPPQQSSVADLWRTRSAGTHFVRLWGWGAYLLTVEGLGPDAHGNTAEDATVLTVSETPVQGAIELREDVDVFVFDAQPGAVYELTCEWVATSLDDQLRLSWRDDPGRSAGLTGSFAPAPSRSVLTFEPLSPTRYTVWVSSERLRAPIPYTCVLRSLRDDH